MPSFGAAQREDCVQRRSILSVGHDPVLLSTRNQVLSTAGYRVVGATVAEARRLVSQEQYDIVIVGHTLSAMERRELITEVRRCHPLHTRVLALNRSEQAPDCDADAFFTADQGPEALLEAVAGLLGRSPEAENEGHDPGSPFRARGASAGPLKAS